jgi:hypothetical protein
LGWTTGNASARKQVLKLEPVHSRQATGLAQGQLLFLEQQNSDFLLELLSGHACGL